MSWGLRLLLLFLTVAGVYGAGFASATRIWYREAEITGLEIKAASAQAKADDALETVRRHGAAAGDAGKRADILEAATAALQQRIDSYERDLASRPVLAPAVGRPGTYRLTADDARRLRDIATAACDRARKIAGPAASAARLAEACTAPDYAEGDDGLVLMGRLLGRLIEANMRLVQAGGWYLQLSAERGRK